MNLLEWLFVFYFRGLIVLGAFLFFILAAVGVWTFTVTFHDIGASLDRSMVDGFRQLPAFLWYLFTR